MSKSQSKRLAHTKSEQSSSIRSKSQKKLSVGLHCGCGKTHPNTNRRRWITVDGTLWEINCFVKTVGKDYAIAVNQLALYKVLFKKIQDIYPDIDLDGLTKGVIGELELMHNKLKGEEKDE